MSLLVDTNILIYAYRHQGGCRERIEACAPAEVAISAVSIVEIESGIAKATRPEPLRRFLEDSIGRYRVLPLDNEAARRAGRLRAQLESQGRPIGHYDTLIAATALAHGLTVVTHNTREFAHVPGLRLEDWYD
ncbi:PIN domain-containing protein [Xylophilus sp.]|uniref:PIN domain-containing protein n=1 Tax=Xylophilus sp. TaxID=2653893 RepID=UPI0013B607C8|nr:PIN domain-containing protein [Xylophilus sp.]KAF1047051.1 MAG: tRNA(fMet)-specific endonuclease VapC [Xylophilus sp.]